MKDLFCNLKKALEAGESAVIASIIESSGSTPRKVGAKMLVTGAGRVCGTVGGGTVEYEACRLAQVFLKDERSGTRGFGLTPYQPEGPGMVCGGDVTIYFQYIDRSDGPAATLADNALEKIKNGEDSWLITDISSGHMALYGKISGFSGLNDPPAGMLGAMTNHPLKYALGGCEYLIEPLVEPGIVYIFGGGHVARELVPAAARVGFRCIVLDDRPEIAVQKLFPGAVGCVLVDFENVAERIDVNGNDYIVVMTHGHRYDTAVQAYAMRTGARYIGVMGSKSKIAYVSEKMRELGFTDEDLARVNTPIGLDIKAETPAEIAVSIVAELIAVRAAK